ncbi:COG3740 Phage head maturation protease [uncultured Caudovirales phage]|uniref:COG3740 Phage head maturation protease n=1 Tax=uncultured Caudovirales phage TaxID=2100421 RepID=A0A6J5PV07_9CAUD|nr:COG3740 Phage head maturation protease [uncultured Caudovirales phage]CAB4203269.1 COG3740 Phage head maturation protease [uncultured Caudovirales phage]
MPSDGYKPTAGMIAEAKRGLEWRREFNRGGTEVGVARARDISNGKLLPEETIRRMSSYFARHEVDKKGQGFSPGEPGFPSAGRIAWALWGGDPGQSFVETITTRLDKKEGRAMPLEIRTKNNAIEFRCEPETKGVLRGYASTFDEPYDMGRFNEVIAAKAFTRTLDEHPDILALVNHDSSKPIARTINGTMRLIEDKHGLAVEISPIATTYAADLMEAVRSGVVNAMSFGFNVRADRFEKRDGKVTRIIEDVDLHEVSIVSFPANPATSIQVDVRSFEAWHGSQSPKRRTFLMFPEA